jgi:hypothetical protein
MNKERYADFEWIVECASQAERQVKLAQVRAELEQLGIVITLEPKRGTSNHQSPLSEAVERREKGRTW